MKRENIFIASVAVAALVALAGCGAARPSKFYTLEMPAGAPAADGAAQQKVSLVVGRITAPHVYRDSRIVYRTGGAEMGAYEYHRWAEPPTEMLEAMFLRTLRASGRYQSVQELRTNARGDFILRGRLHEFQETSGAGLAARVALEMDLFDQATGLSVWSHYYAHNESVDGKEVADVVAAFNRNVHRALREITSALDRHFASNPPQKQ